MNREIYEQNLRDIENLGIGNLQRRSYIDLLKLRAALMCMGVGPSGLTNELAELVNPSGEKRTGNVGIPAMMQTIFGKDFLMSLPTSVVYKGLQKGDPDFTASSPFGLEGSVDDVILTLEGRKLIGLELYPQPSWINKTTSSGKPMTSIFLPESGDNLMAAIRAKGGCEYFKKSEACVFCGLDLLKKGDGKTPEDYAEVAVAAFSERPKTTSLTLTAGNTYSGLRGIEQYLPFVRAIRNAVFDSTGIEPWIEVEASPPDFINNRVLAEETIDALLDAGITSFMSNLEQYSPAARRKALPAKSRIPTSDYEAVFEYVSSKGLPTASVLMVGLDDSNESIIEGAKFLAERGVYPVVLPFRPRGKYANRSPTDPNDLFYVSMEAAKLAVKYE
ncbi:hypothetical protein COV16_04870, partial [Candidatus Woesearchaeota archaeon CG10_big_fil_rev_8_21_14_0_10_34_8]